MSYRVTYLHLSRSFVSLTHLWPHWLSMNGRHILLSDRSWKNPDQTGASKVIKGPYGKERSGKAIDGKIHGTSLLVWSSQDYYYHRHRYSFFCNFKHTRQRFLLNTCIRWLSLQISRFFWNDRSFIDDGYLCYGRRDRRP